MKRLVIALGMFIGLPVRVFAAAGAVDALADFLDGHGVVYDKTNAMAAAMEGMLKAIDPLARFCDEPEALRLEARLSGTVPGVTNVSAVEVVELWPERLCYLKIRGLFEGSGREIDRHLSALDSRAGIILDLRGANGNDYASVVALASAYYTPGDRLFVLQGRGQRASVTNNAVDVPERRAPLMLLTDRQTEQASELLAALCRGLPGVMVLGLPTGGDARVREVLAVPDGRLLYVATAEIVPGEGRQYAGRGVAPDIYVAPAGLPAGPSAAASPGARPPSEKSQQDRDLMMRVAGDAALRRATDILLGLQALGDYGRR